MRPIELTDMNASMEVATSIPLGTFPAGMNVPVPTGSSSPLEYAESVGGLTCHSPGTSIGRTADTT